VSGVEIFEDSLANSALLKICIYGNGFVFADTMRKMQKWRPNLLFPIFLPRNPTFSFLDK